MDKGLSITGYKKSGKTTLMLQLSREFKNRGINVSGAKFSHHSLDKNNTDSARISAQTLDFAALTNDQTLMCWSEKKFLPDLLPLMNGDILLVEGGKELGWLPRVLTLREPGEAAELDQGLALATWGTVSTDYLPHFEKIEELADYILPRSFILPGLNCGYCGHETCLELAKKIISRESDHSDCKARNSSLEIKINGQALGMNSFVERVITGSILGMLAELKGYSPGQVEISIK